MTKRGFTARRQQWVAGVMIALLGIVAYLNTFTVPLFFDDRTSLERNPQIRSLNPFRFPPEGPTTVTGRPVLIFTFALNYAISGLNVWSYHATNLAIHIACGLLLFAIVRRTLLQKQAWGDRFTDSAVWLAAAVAGIWIVHPLNTQAVTFTSQRAESLAGLFFLASLYSFIRAIEGGKWWGLSAVILCALGMGTKEIVAALPFLALLYDRAFVSGSFAAAWRARWRIYLGLAAGYGMILYSLHTGLRGTMVGFHVGIGALEYARTELNIMARYLGLAFWPVNLVFDYQDWPIAHRWTDVTPQGWLVLALAVATVAAIWHRPWLGFQGVWFFAILAPTSSFLPIKEEAAGEWRMYLPLMAVISLAVCVGFVIVERWKFRSRGVVFVVIVLVGVLTWRTIERNGLYEFPELLWADTLAKRPNDMRAHLNLGNEYARIGRGYAAGSPERVGAAKMAADEYRRVVDREPDYSWAVFGLGASLEMMDDPGAAELFYSEELGKAPDLTADLLVERGALRARRGDLFAARQDLIRSLELKPDNEAARQMLHSVNEVSATRPEQ